MGLKTPRDRTYPRPTLAQQSVSVPEEIGNASVVFVSREVVFLFSVEPVSGCPSFKFGYAR